MSDNCILKIIRCITKSYYAEAINKVSLKLFNRNVNTSLINVYN